MIRIASLFFVALVFSLSVLAAEISEPPFTEEQAIRQMVEVMSPVHDQWLRESETFSEQAKTFCAKGKKLDALREQWRNTQKSWSALGAFSIGPLTENGYLNTQVQYWPDKKNLVQFQMRDALRRQLLESLDVAQLSVAMRGLSASEFMLFDVEVKLDQATERERYCPLLLSNASYQQKLARQVQQEWQQYQPMPVLPNERFATVHDVLTEWFRVQVSALEIQHKKLALPLGSSQQGKNTPQPYQAEYWRSAQSLASLRAAVDMHHQVWQQGWRPLVLSLNKTLALQVDEKFKQIEMQIDSMKMPIPELLKTDQGIKTLQDTVALLDELRSVYETSIAKTINIQIGFNANDGD